MVVNKIALIIMRLGGAYLFGGHASFPGKPVEKAMHLFSRILRKKDAYLRPICIQKPENIFKKMHAFGNMHLNHQKPLQKDAYLLLVCIFFSEKSSKKMHTGNHGFFARPTC